MAEFVKTPKQVEATRIMSGDALHILLCGGSRSGKTLLILRAVVIRGLKAPYSTHCVIRRTFKDAKQKIGLTSFPQMMRLCFPQVKYHINKQEWFIEIEVGRDEDGQAITSRIWLAGLDDIAERDERILGHEFSTLFFNEISEIAYNSVTTALTRLAEKNCLTKRVYYDCNPTSVKHWGYKLFVEYKNPVTGEEVDRSDYVSCRLNPVDNVENLDAQYMRLLESLPSRKRRRFMDGEWAVEDLGKLFQREDIDSYRVLEVPPLRRIVIAIDPAVSSNPGSDDFGVCIAGVGMDRHFYILEDATMQGVSPDYWVTRVIDLYREYQADRVVAEVNQGGDLVEHAILQVDDTVPVTKIHASRNKFLRAEPVAALYERGRVHHVNGLPDLEEEMVLFDPEKHRRSPGRMDALVYAVTELAESGVFLPTVLLDTDEQGKLSQKEFARRQEAWERDLVNNEAVWQ